MEINTNMSLLPMQARQAQAADVLPTGLERAQNREDKSVTQAAQAAETPKQKAEYDREELEEMIDSMQQAVKAMQRNLNFSVHDNTGMTIVKVMDAGSGEVIRQMPTEDALRLAERLDEMRSLLFEARA